MKITVCIMPVCSGYVNSYLNKWLMMIEKDKHVAHEEALAKLLVFSYRQDTPPMMRNDRRIMELFFDEITKGLSEFKYTHLWYAINQVVRQDDKEWLYRYWEFADQYYSHVFAYAEKDEKAERFFEFHVAVGGLLALNEKYDWIEHIAMFTNCLPPKYFLIPSTFSEIFKWLLRFAEMVESSVKIDVRYQLYSQYEGVRAGANLYRGIVKYLAMMMCRLSEMNFNVRYIDPLGLPYIYGTNPKEKKDAVSVNLRNIQIAEFFKDIVESLAVQDEKAKQESIELIKGYIGACRNIISSEKETDQDKINRIATILLSEFDRQKSFLVTKKNSDLKNSSKHSWFIESSALLEEYDFLVGRNYNNINRESMMVGRIMQGAIVRYNESLNTGCAVCTYTVRFSDIAEAIERLRLSNEYVLLVGAIGTHLLPVGYANSQNLHFIHTRQPVILVLRKAILPFICFEDNVNCEEDWKLIDKKKNNMLYSNIWNLQEDCETKKKAEEKKSFELKVGCQISVCSPQNEQLKYVCIKATDGITQDAFDLYKIRNINEIGV